jgi:hypothetical protein
VGRQCQPKHGCREGGGWEKIRKIKKDGAEGEVHVWDKPRMKLGENILRGVSPLYLGHSPVGWRKGNNSLNSAAARAAGGKR